MSHLCSEDWDTTAEANASCLCIHGESEETSNELNFAGTSSPVDLEPTSENCQPCCEKQTNARKRSFKQTESPQQCLCQKQYKVSRPRIVRRDYRRDFPMLWVHVMNTGSYDFMMEHIRTYYSPDMVLRQRDLRAGEIITFLPFFPVHPMPADYLYKILAPTVGTMLQKLTVLSFLFHIPT